MLRGDALARLPSTSARRLVKPTHLRFYNSTNAATDPLVSQTDMLSLRVDATALYPYGDSFKILYAFLHRLDDMVHDHGGQLLVLNGPANGLQRAFYIERESMMARGEDEYKVAMQTMWMRWVVKAVACGAVHIACGHEGCECQTSFESGADWKLLVG
jgi:hypothetical protein